MVKVPLPAVDVPKNCIMLPGAPATAPPLMVKAVRLPAAALLVNAIVPKLLASSTGATKFCMIPELFVMPTPLMVNVNMGLAVIVNALPPELNTVPLTSVLADRDTVVISEVAKKAVSDGPLGGPPAVQLPAVFQSPVVGLANHVALPAKLLLAVKIRSVRMAAAAGRKAQARKRRGEGDAPRSDGAM